MEDSQLAELFHRCGYLVHRRCMAVLQNRADADDALQEVFLRVRRYAGTQRGDSHLSWLYSIAFNVCCDQMKSRRRELPHSPDSLRERDTRTVDSAADSDRRAMIGAVLQIVGPRTREIAVLHHVSGLTQEEVALESGYSRRTVGKKLQAFARLLKQHFGSVGEET